MSNDVAILKKKIAVMKQMKLIKDRRKLYDNFWFPPNSEYSIEKYAKHKQFIELAHEYRVRLFMGGNRCGKSWLAEFELTCHALGWYPEWWTGVRFEHKKGKNFKIWIVSDSFETSRDIIQMPLFYEDEGAEFGTGFIPFDSIIETKSLSGVANCLSYVRIRRKCGGIATIFFKSSAAGRKKFQGTAIDLIVFDEEPPLEIYEECLLRTMTTGGRVDLYFTPLSGLTPMIELFEKDRDDPSARKISTSVGWDDCPHITEEMKQEMKSNMPEFQYEARSKGIPTLGAGAIYRYTEQHVTCEPFAIPNHYECWYSLDVGWKTTAVTFFAKDPNSNIMYVYDELYIHEERPDQYARKIKMRGETLRGVIDPASAGSSQHDGKSIVDLLRKEGLDLSKANNDVEFGIMKVSEAFNFEKLKIFNTCKSLISEYRSYHRDEKGKIVKTKDHALDAMRYGVVSGEAVKRVKNYKPRDTSFDKYDKNTSWMG